MSLDRRQLLLATWAAAAAAGCGYSTGFTLRGGDTLVGAEFFDNRCKQPDLEVELHAHLTDAMTRMVHAPLVEPRSADLVVRGAIVDYRRRNGIRTGENQLLESGLRVTVRAVLVRRRTLPPGGAQDAEPLPDDPRGLGRDPDELDEPPRDPRTALARTLLRPGERILREVTFSQESGFRLQEPGGELAARERVLRSLADRIVLDLFAALAYEGSP